MQRNITRSQFVKGAGTVAAVASLGAAVTAFADEGGAEASVTAHHTWEVSPEPIEDISDTIETEIAIIGAGVSGCSCAYTAAKNGADVTVVEAFYQPTYRGASNGTVNSKYSIENGRVFDEMELFKGMNQWAHLKVDQAMVMVWFKKSGEVFDELADLMAEKYGYEEYPGGGTRQGLADVEMFYRQYPTDVTFGASTLFLEDGDFSQGLMVKGIAEQAQAEGATFMFNTHAEQLVKDGDGRVTGVIVLNEDGSYTQINASKAVVLAAGDIGGNPEMVEAWAPFYARGDNYYVPPTYNDGSGILMGLWAGAGIQYGPAATMIHGCILDANAQARNLSPQDFGWLCVNSLGERYTAEVPNEVSTANARCMQPGGHSWYVFDGAYADKALAMNPANKGGWGVVIDDKTQGIIDSYIEEGKMVKGDTIEELAAAISASEWSFGMTCDPETLAATIERYNGMCDAGVDTDFGKDAEWLVNTKVDTPPYYAGYVPANSFVCIKGLNTDIQCHVCDDLKNPIPGLYAVGNCQGNFFADDYPLMACGVSHGRAITFGWLLGKALATGTEIDTTGEA